ncbi:unnamed protein product [Symbiodinium sp. CCMP2592]|nr:unnamed protein product [Symbiodinium sp. CCMP2592]
MCFRMSSFHVLGAVFVVPFHAAAFREVAKNLEHSGDWDTADLCGGELNLYIAEKPKSGGSGTQKERRNMPNGIMFVHYACYVKAGMWHPQYFVRSQRYSVACATGILTESTIYTKLKEDDIKQYELSSCVAEEDYQDLDEKKREIPLLKDMKNTSDIVDFLVDDAFDTMTNADIDSLFHEGGLLVVNLLGGAVMRVSSHHGKLWKSPAVPVSRYTFAVAAKK